MLHYAVMLLLLLLLTKVSLLSGRVGHSTAERRLSKPGSKTVPILATVGFSS
jgi:hypothetical protein